MGAGATISKALNRIVATGTAGFLALGVEQVADFCGHPWGAVFIGASVMVIGESQKSITFISLSHHCSTYYLQCQRLPQILCIKYKSSEKQSCD
jgi:hypothetical protein